MFRHIYYFARIVDIIDMGYSGMGERLLLVSNFIYIFIYIFGIICFLNFSRWIL